MSPGLAVRRLRTISTAQSAPLTHFVLAVAARACLAALILATVLVALSYRLLGLPGRKA